MKLLVTRPEPDGARTAAALRARGHEALVVPMLRIEAVAAELPDESFEAVVLTSANAARALADQPVQAQLMRAQLLALPVFTVGRRSAAAARAAGFGTVRSADGDLGDLVALIAAQRLRRPLLYLAGEDLAGDLAGMLSARGITVCTVVIYRAKMVARLPGDVEAALREHRLDGVLHFSRRSAEAYLACARAAGLAAAALVPAHYCMSSHVASALAGATRLVIASRPDEAALLALVGDPAGERSC